MDIPGENPKRAIGPTVNRPPPSWNKSYCRPSSPAAPTPLPGALSKLGYGQPCCRRSDPDSDAVAGLSSGQSQRTHASLLPSEVVTYPQAQLQASLDPPRLASILLPPQYNMSTAGRTLSTTTTDVASPLSPRALLHLTTIEEYDELEKLRSQAGRINQDATIVFTMPQDLQGRHQTNLDAPRLSRAPLSQRLPKGDLSTPDLAPHVINCVRSSTSQPPKRLRGVYDVVVIGSGYRGGISSSRMGHQDHHPRLHQRDPHLEKPCTGGGHIASPLWTWDSMESMSHPSSFYDQRAAKESTLPCFTSKAEPIGSSFSAAGNGDLEEMFLLDGEDSAIGDNNDSSERDTAQRMFTTRWKHTDESAKDLQESSKLNSSFCLEQGGDQTARATEVKTSHTFKQELNSTDIWSFGCMFMLFILAKAAMLFLGFPNLGLGLSFHHGGILLKVGLILGSLASWGHGRLRNAPAANDSTAKSDHEVRYAFGSKSNTEHPTGVSRWMGGDFDAISL